ncbi:MAG: DUF4252 domain-containing protein [Tannerella sp.]|jgi:transcription antitermination factor NusA-like protein|nr:DUF4252 domain-containing protein [Tannerella sp.]
MEKGIFITLLAVIISQSCFSQENIEKNKSDKQNTVEQLFNSFSKEKNTTHVKIGGFAMLLTRVFTDTKGVSGVDVYSFDECHNSVKESFNAAIKELKDKSYETLVSTSENGEITKVLVKIKDDYINEIVVISGGSDPALIRIEGKIKPEDIKSVIDNNK